MAIKRLRRNVAYGLNNSLQELAPLPIEATRAPTTSDGAEIGTTWVNTTTGSVYVLAKASAGSYTWSTSPGSGVGTFTSLAVSTGDLTFAGGATGNIVMPVGDLTLTAGNATIGGDLTVVGVLSFTGDFDMTTASLFDITATGGQDPAIKLVTNGGVNETIQIISTQGTAADAIDINAIDGDILLQTNNSTDAFSIQLSSISGGILSTSALLNSMKSTRANAAAINIEATAGGIDINASGASAGLDIDITAGGSSVNITATEDVNDSIIIGSATGGINIYTAAASAAKDITISSTGSSIVATASESVADAVIIHASGAAGGVQIKAGSSGILIGNEADTAIIDAGNIAPTATRLITVGGGQVATAAVTDTIDIGVDGATANANSTKIVNVGSGALDTGVNTVNIATGTVASGTHAVNVSTGTGTKTVNFGNADGLTTTALLGALNVNVSQNNNTAINTGTSTGTISVGGASAGAITVDTAAGISLDGVTASNFTVTGAATLSLISTLGAVSITSGLDSVANSIVIDATAADSGIDIDAGTNGISLSAEAGDVTLATTTSGDIHLSSVDNNVIWNFDEQIVASATAAVTSNTHNGHAVFTGFTTASAASQVFTITNSVIGIATPIFITACNAGANDAQMTVMRVKKLAGSAEVTLTNNGAAALNGDVNITWLIYAA